MTEKTGNFEQRIALDSLALIKEAQEQFQRARKEPKYDWESDTSSIIVNGKEYKKLANLGFAQIFGLKRKRVPFGFILQQEDTEDIYVVFRGTENKAEWFANFKFMQSSYKDDNPLLSKSGQKNDQIDVGKIHHGFYTTYTRWDSGSFIDHIYDLNPDNNQLSMRDKIEETLIKNCHKNSRLFVTGHSLGGALATISTLHIHVTEEIVLKPILYSFASPRVGDKKFADNFKNLECYRIANSEDIVPKIPLPGLLIDFAVGVGAKELQYHHIGMPIYFTQGKGNIGENHSLNTYVNAVKKIQ